MAVPAQTDEFLLTAVPHVAEYVPMVDEVLAADTSLMKEFGHAAFVDVARYSAANWRWLVQNSTTVTRKE